MLGAAALIPKEALFLPSEALLVPTKTIFLPPVGGWASVLYPGLKAIWEAHYNNFPRDWELLYAS